MGARSGSECVSRVLQRQWECDLRHRVASLLLFALFFLYFFGLSCSVYPEVERKQLNKPGYRSEDKADSVCTSGGKRSLKVVPVLQALGM